MSRRTLATISAAAVAAMMTASAACGDGGEDKSATPHAAAATAAPAPKIAPELIGTWQARVRRSEIPDLRPGPNGLGPDWEIEILEDGGIDGAPTLVYVNEAGEIRGAYSYTVSGDRIAITDDNCSSGPTENVYAFAVESDELTFETVENQCRDQVLEALLTARPWRRA
jgi:hypothetical protein